MGYIVNLTIRSKFYEIATGDGTFHCMGGFALLLNISNQEQNFVGMQDEETRQQVICETKTPHSLVFFTISDGYITNSQSDHRYRRSLVRIPFRPEIRITFQAQVVYITATISSVFVSFFAVQISDFLCIHLYTRCKLRRRKSPRHK